MNQKLTSPNNILQAFKQQHAEEIENIQVTESQDDEDQIENDKKKPQVDPKEKDFSELNLVNNREARKIITNMRYLDRVTSSRLALTSDGYQGNEER